MRMYVQERDGCARLLWCALGLKRGVGQQGRLLRPSNACCQPASHGAHLSQRTGCDRYRAVKTCQSATEAPDCHAVRYLF